MKQCTDYLDLRIGQAQFKIRPYIVNWISYDTILGKRWLTDINPIIDWTRNRMRVKLKNQIQTLDAGRRSDRVSHLKGLLSSKQFARLVKKKKIRCYYVLLKPFNKDDEVEQNNDELEETFKNYEDVFSEKFTSRLVTRKKHRDENTTDGRRKTKDRSYI